MYDLGINRISFGTQSFNDKKLKLLNRAHSAKQAKKSNAKTKKSKEKKIAISKELYDEITRLTESIL